MRHNCKSGLFVPKKSTSVTTKECYRRATKARHMADAATDRTEKADFREIEKRWLSLAENHWADEAKKAPRRPRKR